MPIFVNKVNKSFIRKVKQYFSRGYIAFDFIRTTYNNINCTLLTLDKYTSLHLIASSYKSECKSSSSAFFYLFMYTHISACITKTNDLVFLSTVSYYAHQNNHHHHLSLLTSTTAKLSFCVCVCVLRCIL